MRMKVGLLRICTGGREAEVQVPGNFEGPGAGRECRWGGMPSSGSSSRMAAQAWAPPSAPQPPLQPMGGQVLHQGRGHYLQGNKKLQAGGGPEELPVNPLLSRTRV